MGWGVLGALPEGAAFQVIGAEAGMSQEVLEYSVLGVKWCRPEVFCGAYVCVSLA